VDFPTRIRADPPLSIQGLTFLRNRMPDGETVAKAIYVSPLFAGPDGPRGPGFPSQTLDSPGAWMGKDMPLPSMMLGFLGLRGNTRDEIGACLRRGVQADGTAPEGTVYFVTNTNIRSLARGWEFAPVVRELRELGVRAIVTNALPGGEQEVLGLVTGSASVDTTTPRRFLPGAMAEHLTSFGAAFDTGDQTKITEWIRAGATASAGTVTEPMALWPKFPHARFFTHLASGCTTLESFYLSLRCPLQTLLVGDPLAAPWAPVSRISLQGIDTGRLRDRTTVTAVVQARHGEMFNRYLFLMDGKIVQEAGKTPTASIDPAALAAGPHALRVVAYRVGTVRGQIFTELAFTVDRK
jgi:hypothetical protein